MTHTPPQGSQTSRADALLNRFIMVVVAGMGLFLCLPLTWISFQSLRDTLGEGSFPSLWAFLALALGVALTIVSGGLMLRAVLPGKPSPTARAEDALSGDEPARGEADGE